MVGIVSGRGNFKKVLIDCLDIMFEWVLIQLDMWEAPRSRLAVAYRGEVLGCSNPPPKKKF